MLPFEEVTSKCHDGQSKQEGKKDGRTRTARIGQMSSYEDPTDRSTADNDGHDESLGTELFARMTSHEPHRVALAVHSNEGHFMDETEDSSSTNDAIADQTSSKVQHGVLGPLPEGIKQEVAKNADNTDRSSDHQHALVIGDTDLQVVVV